MTSRPSRYGVHSSPRSAYDATVRVATSVPSLLPFRRPAPRFSHSSLGALRVLAYFSASRRLLETSSRYGVVLDPSIWCSFVARRRIERKYSGFDVRLSSFKFALVLQLSEPAAKAVPFDSRRRREHNGVDDEVQGKSTSGVRPFSFFASCACRRSRRGKSTKGWRQAKKSENVRPLLPSTLDRADGNFQNVANHCRPSRYTVHSSRGNV